MSSTKQVYRINFKDVFKVEMNKKNASDHREYPSAYSTLQAEKTHASRGFARNSVGSHPQNDLYLSAHSKCVSRHFLAGGAPRPSQVQQLQMGPQGTSKPVTRKSAFNTGLPSQTRPQNART